MRIAVLVALLALARPALADDGEELSPSTAAALSLVPTLGGIALAAWGSTQPVGARENTMVALGIGIANLGPTVGNIYARDVWNTGLATRVVSVGVGTAGFAMVVASSCFIDCGPSGSQGLATAGSVVVWVAGLAYITGAGLEIINAPRAARRYNERLASSSTISLVPVVAPERAGLALAGTF